MMAVRPGRCIAFAAIVAVAGCSEPDAVRVQNEPAQSRPSVPPIPADQKQYRTLAVMVPADAGEGASWGFFKMSGPTAIVNKYEGDFDKLIKTISVNTDTTNPFSWEMPSGWDQEPGKSGAMRIATLKSPGDEIQISVTKFGGTVLANAQRWWGELWGSDKAQDFTVAMLSEYVRQVNVKGRLILRADLYGPKEPPKRGMGPMMNPHGKGQ
jgi:hypothetical protein